jgi:hypothetical protein
MPKVSRDNAPQRQEAGPVVDLRGHRADPPAARRALPVPGARDNPGQGQGEDAHLLPERANRRPNPIPDLTKPS